MIKNVVTLGFGPGVNPLLVALGFSAAPPLVPGQHVTLQADPPDVFGGQHISLQADTDTFGGPHTTVPL